MTNLGLIHLVDSSRALCLYWRPTFVTESCFAGAALALRRHPERRVMVSTLATDWTHRLCASREVARDHLIELLCTSVCEDEGHFRARRRRIDDLPGSHRLARLADALAGLERPIGPVELWNTLTAHADRRYVLLEAAGERGPLRVLAWGGGYRTFDEQWVNSVSGRSFEDQPDRAYGRWVTQIYRATAARREPRLEDVEASIWLPRRGRCIVRYTRLVLPVEIRGRGLCLLSSAQAQLAS